MHRMFKAEKKLKPSTWIRVGILCDNNLQCIHKHMERLSAMTEIVCFLMDFSSRNHFFLFNSHDIKNQWIITMSGHWIPQNHAFTTFLIHFLHHWNTIKKKKQFSPWFSFLFHVQFNLSSLFKPISSFDRSITENTHLCPLWSHSSKL